MGTRSTTIIMSGEHELCRIYRQFDGYPDGHGVDLAKLCDVEIINGMRGDEKMGTHANGMGCLAAQVVAGLKDKIGGIYLEPTGGDVNDWCEYIYIVRGAVGQRPTIECASQAGPFPFNIQTDDLVFAAMPAAKVIEKYSGSAAA
jgi:hypothetical protein